MSLDLQALWKSIEEEPGSEGEVRRRIHPDSPYDIFVCQTRPLRRRLLRAAFKSPPGTAWRQLHSSIGLRIRVDGTAADKSKIEITEEDPKFHELFDALVKDLVDGLERLADSSMGSSPLPLDFVAGRILRWQRFFRSTPDGLSDERQVGLYGELKVLSMLLNFGVDAGEATGAWTGPEGAAQDFRWRGTAVEVKTSRQAQPVAVVVSSERQLDDSDGVRVFLLHNAIDDRTDGIGETLPTVVAELRTRVGVDGAARMVLDDALIAYGYLDHHADRYIKSLSVRYVDCFRVVDGFPRIAEAELPTGVGQVSYSVSLAACEPFRCELEDIVQAIDEEPG